MSPSPSPATDGDLRVAAALAIVVSIFVIVAATAGYQPLAFVLFFLVWIPGGPFLWFLGPIGLTGLAAVAVHQALRSRRVLPRIFAGAAVVFALWTFTAFAYASMVFENAME